jgi:hypothetical protein
MFVEKEFSWKRRAERARGQVRMVDTIKALYKLLWKC